MNKKQQLIQDIQNLLNGYENLQETFVNPKMLEFMDEKSLIAIIDSLLTQKESLQKSDLAWLEKFKKYEN